MHNDIEFDRQIANDLRAAADRVAASADCKRRIDARILRAESETAKGGRKRMAMWTMKKAAAAVAMCCLMIGTVVLAAGKITSVYSHNALGTEVESYGEVEALEKEAGYEVVAKEQFGNGFTFAGGEIVDNEGMDESGNAVSSWKGIDLTYHDDAGRSVFVAMEPASSPSQDLSVNTLETRTFHGTEVYYDRIEQKLVPPDYVPTEEEQARSENDPQFMISYGSDEISTKFISEVCFNAGDVRYFILSFDEISADELYSMAEELLE